MREIKFRAWLKARKQMVEVVTIEFMDTGIPGILIRYVRDGRICEAFPGDFEIMQFTGLKDKNGKEIWEGDIVRDSFGSLYVIEWIDNIMNFVGKPLTTQSKVSDVDISDLEVVGNIYENPELFGGAK